MTLDHLDLDLLRTFVAGVDLGSFARAAETLGRTQSAVSLQMRRLEEQAGQPLLQKQGRMLVPNGAGEELLSYARRILALNDEALSQVRATRFEGALKIGLPQDFVETEFASVLGRFAHSYPAIRLDVQVDRKGVLMELTRKSELDFALHFGPASSDSIIKLSSVWIGPRGHRYSRGETQPLAMCTAPCLFRDAATSALGKARIPWRMAFTSLSLAGVWAAVGAGLGVTVRTRVGVPSNLQELGQESSLPRLPAVGLHLLRSPSPLSPAARRLESELVETLKARQAQWR